MKSSCGFLAIAVTPALAAYDEAVALEYAYLCTASMCSPGATSPTTASLEAWDCGAACDAVPGMTDVRAIESAKANDAFAYIGKKNGECLAVFRGTSDLAGWIEDLKSAKLVDLKSDLGAEICSYNGTTCKVGDGFMDNYNSVATSVKGNLTEIGCTKGSALSITGHSLGAAEAAIAMFDLKNEGYDIVETYTFGQPRVGDQVFADAYEAAFGQTASDTNAWRVTHADDPIPHLPFEFMDFTHISTEVWYESTTSKGYKVCDGSGEDPTCSNSKSDLVPAASITCATDQAKCAHLNYMTDSKTISMDGSSCTERSQAVSI
jgi:hypothetical protein